MPDPSGFPAVRPEKTFPNSGIQIPVILGVGIGIVQDSGNPNVRGALCHTVTKWQNIPAILGIHPPGQHEMFGVIHAHHTLRPDFRIRQGRQEHSGKNRNDGYDNQQFN